MRTLYPPSEVLSLRHTPTWLVLAFGAGSVNAIGFLACARFVTHITGIATRIGMDGGTIILAVEYGAVLASFVLGAMTSAVLIEGRHHQRKKAYHGGTLVLVSALLVAIALCGQLGVFGTFGGSVEHAGDFVFLSVLAFAMGIQNAAVATSTGLLVRTTHMTGPATDVGVHLVSAFYTKGATRSHALKNAGLRAGNIVAFAVGGAAGGALGLRYGFLSFFLPATAVALGTSLSFARVGTTRSTAQPSIPPPNGAMSA